MKKNLILLLILSIQCNYCPKIGAFFASIFQTPTIQQQWFDAAYSGNLNALQQLLSKIDPHARDADNYNALHLACIAGNDFVVGFLLKISGFDINAQATNCGHTALHLAIEHNHDSIVLFLLDAWGIQVNRKNTAGYTPLAWAIIYKNTKAVSLLLKHPNIDIFIKDSEERTALQLAERFKREPLVALIKNKQRQLELALFDAIKTNDSKQLGSLINTVGLHIFDDEGDTPLHKACKYKNKDIAQLLFESTLDPHELIWILNKQGNSVLEFLSTDNPLFNTCLEIAFSEKFKQPAAPLKPLKQKLCGFCSKDGCINLCGRCKKTYYCSVECQKKHWRYHKKLCKQT